MDLDITFRNTTIRITVYLKMDAQEQLLLSEGVCSQLGLVTYHPEVAATHVQGLAAEDREPTELVQVPVMSVQLESMTSVLPHSEARADICILQVGPYPCQLMVKGDRNLKSTLGIELVDTLLEPSNDGTASVMFPVGSPAESRKAAPYIGTVAKGSILEPASSSEDTSASDCTVPVPGEVSPASVEERRKEKLLEAIVLPELHEAEKGKLQVFLEKHHLRILPGTCRTR